MLVHNILSFASIQLFSKLVTLLTLYVIAFLVSNEMFGYVTLVQAGFVSALTLFGFNLQSVFVRYYYESNFQFIFLLLQPIYLVLGIVSIISTSVIFYLTYYHDYFRWFSLLPVCGYLSGGVFVLSMTARCNSDILNFTVAELSRPMLFSMSIFILWILDIMNYVVVLYVLTIFFSSLIVLVVCKPYQKNENVYFSFNKLSTKKLFLYVFPLFLVQVTSILNNVSDRYILKLYLPIEYVGQYGKAYLFGSAVGMLIDSLVLLWAPYIIKNKEAFFKNIYRWTKCIVFIAFLGSLCVLTISFYVFKMKLLVFGFDTQAVVVGLVVMAAFLVRCGYQVYIPILCAYDKTTIVAKISVIGALVGLALNFLLIPGFGGYGSAIATFVSFFLISIMSYWTVHRLATQA